ncbi:MAG: hypothetical protein WBF93_21460 [Pirellulales bacterium]
MVDSPAIAPAVDRTSIILLGASNLTRAISTIVETTHQLCGSPLDIYAALGHGRSYGMTSSVLVRRLPGILQCGLWDALPQASPAPINALITDIGNDLIYGADPELIAEWIEQCLARLASHEADIVLTQLPLQNIEALSPARYVVLRTVLFPFCRHDLTTMLRLAHQLDQHVQQLAQEYQTHLVAPQPEWYGIDPIHIKIRHWSTAWPTILAPWSKAATLPPPAAGSLRRWFYLRTRAPLQRQILGWPQRHEQPCGVLPNGSAIHFF